MGTMFLCNIAPIEVMIIIGALQKSIVSIYFGMFFYRMVVIDYWSFYPFWYPVIDLMQATNFLVIITKINPGKAPCKWDVISRAMNQYLTENGHS